MALTKIDETVLYAIASTASNTIDEGSALDCSTYYTGVVRIRMGRGSGTAFTVAPTIRLLWTAESGTPTANQWGTLDEVVCRIGASIGSQAVSGTEAAGETTVTLAAGTNFAAKDLVFWHNGTLANSEWSNVQSVSGADLIISEGLVSAQTGATARNQAQTWTLGPYDLRGVNKLRLQVDGAGSGQAVIVEAVIGGNTAE